MYIYVFVGWSYLYIIRAMYLFIENLDTTSYNMYYPLAQHLETINVMSFSWED